MINDGWFLIWAVLHPNTNRIRTLIDQTVKLQPVFKIKCSYLMFYANLWWTGAHWSQWHLNMLKCVSTRYYWDNFHPCSRQQKRICLTRLLCLCECSWNVKLQRGQMFNGSAVCRKVNCPYLLWRLGRHYKTRTITSDEIDNSNKNTAATWYSLSHKHLVE